MSDMGSGYDSWSCPFCGKVASLQTTRHVLCDSRTCSCGAIALAAPWRDTDEIIDDALGIFAIQIREESRGMDHLMLQDLHQAGVEIGEGESTLINNGFSTTEYRSLWFRKLS